MQLVRFLVTFVVFTFGSCEIFTAISDLNDIVHSEKILSDTLEKYIKEDELRLDTIRRYAKLYKRQYSSEDDIETYVTNPINAYLLVKRLTIDWNEVKSLMKKNTGTEYLNHISNYTEQLKFPTNADLKGAAEALTRLQDTYKLETSSMARGELGGVKYSSEMSASDCFEIGRQAHNNSDFPQSILWMREADARLGQDFRKTVNRSDILEYMANSAFKDGYIDRALHLTQELVEKFPSHPRALGRKMFYEESLRNQTKKKANVEHMSPEEIQHMLILTAYKKNCRDGTTIPADVAAKLNCYYSYRNNPFLLIAPFKVEEVYSSPKVVIFHDVLSDNEIEAIRELAKPKLQRAHVFNFNTGVISETHDRLSKYAWFGFEHGIVEKIYKRASDMTGLSVKTAEILQVANYGIGGYYTPHYDFGEESKAHLFNGHGNRIATLLFYMTDVAQGGATVFPRIKVSISPKKGSAVFWYNLHSNGKGDRRTGHAACPVLVGNKWVSNIWLHEHGQEFLRPCELNKTR